MCAFSSWFLCKQLKSSNDVIVYTISYDSFCTACCIFSAQIASQLSHMYSHTNLFSEYMNSLKIIHKEEYFVSNLVNVLQRNLRTDRARECIFRGFGGTILKMYLLRTNHGCAFVDLMGRYKISKIKKDPSIKLSSQKHVLCHHCLPVFLFVFCHVMWLLHNFCDHPQQIM